MNSFEGIGPLAFVSVMALVGGSSCAADSSSPDSGNIDACNDAIVCDYGTILDPIAMEYQAFFFDYVCSGDTVDSLRAEVLPESGCFIVLVGEWVDVFADKGCENHCVEPGWICHYVDVETDTAWVEHRYPPDESPILGNLPQVTNPTILEVPCQEKVYRFDQSNEDWTWEDPPTEFERVLRMVRCNGCEGGSHDIVLPLE